ncbi:transposase [Acidithiobacillus ferrianus]|uniref:Transposase zinc-ribbon domain-containing protein n=1 Tax=Acidithiobacillus ferrianus TaxID=2678518 RepID=A0A845UDM7_9PROT|nr:hypothetical protein [Acidithiobacillus ferrianus]
MLILLVDKPPKIAYSCRMDERGFPTTLPEFQRVFPDEAGCASYLESLRWPEGFVCAHCGLKDKPYRFGTRSSTVFRCRGCDKTTSLTAGRCQLIV